MANMGNPEFVMVQKFPSIQIFRDVVRECNVNKGNDVKFKKNYLARCIMVCKDTCCKYKIYGRKCKDEESFEI